MLPSFGLRIRTGLALSPAVANRSFFAPNIELRITIPGSFLGKGQLLSRYPPYKIGGQGISTLHGTLEPVRSFDLTETLVPSSDCSSNRAEAVQSLVINLYRSLFETRRISTPVKQAYPRPLMKRPSGQQLGLLLTSLARES
jgi:hypothetical protein